MKKILTLTTIAILSTLSLNLSAQETKTFWYVLNPVKANVNSETATPPAPVDPIVNQTLSCSFSAPCSPIDGYTVSYIAEPYYFAGTVQYVCEYTEISTSQLKAYLNCDTNEDGTNGYENIEYY